MNKNFVTLLKAEPLVKRCEKDWLEFARTNHIAPHIHVIIVGDSPPSHLYVNKKIEACERVGVLSTVHRFKSATTQTLIRLINTLNNTDSCHGILVQCPLPDDVDTAKVLQHINPQKDIDGFHCENRGAHLLGLPCFVPCTALGIDRLLRYYQVCLTGKNVAVIGRSAVVGLPTFVSLQSQGATVSLFHAQSNMDNVLWKDFDIVVLATGSDLSSLAPKFCAHHIIIDVGIFYHEGKVLGDLRLGYRDCQVAARTPVPGGVGPMTVNSLIYNAYLATIRHHHLGDLEQEFVTLSRSPKA